MRSLRSPTPRALEAAAKAKQALGLNHEALSGVARDEAGYNSELRIVAVNSLAFSLLPRLVRPLHRALPNMRVTIRPADVHLTCELLEADECDMVIGYPPIVSGSLPALQGHAGAQGTGAAAAEAHRILEASEHVGKVVLSCR